MSRIASQAPAAAAAGRGAEGAAAGDGAAQVLWHPGVPVGGGMLGTRHAEHAPRWHTSPCLPAAAHLPARGSELRVPLQATVHGRRVVAVPASMSGRGSAEVDFEVKFCAGGCAAPQGQRGAGGT